MNTCVYLESKIDSIAMELNLLHTDHRKLADKVCMAEQNIAELQLAFKVLVS